MSKTAYAFLLLTLLCSALLWAAPENAVHTPLAIAASLFGCGFLGALVVGRKVRFDPILRRS